MNWFQEILIAVVACGLIFWGIVTYAAEAKIEAQWAYNNNASTVIEGFKFYLNGEVVQDVKDPLARTSTWIIDLANGSHTFSMTAYGKHDTLPWESMHSPDYKFEYLNVSQDNAAPMLLIKIY